jgi:hypothetical protein
MAHCQIGLYHYSVENDVWSWSPDIYRMHGDEPGSVVSTTELLVKHRHPADRRHLTDAIERALRTAELFSCQQRIVAADGRIWSVVVGEADRADDGTVNVIHSYFVDLTSSLCWKRISSSKRRTKRRVCSRPWPRAPSLSRPRA